MWIAEVIYSYLGTVGRLSVDFVCLHSADSKISNRGNELSKLLLGIVGSSPFFFPFVQLLTLLCSCAITSFYSTPE